MRCSGLGDRKEASKGSLRAPPRDTLRSRHLDAERRATTRRKDRYPVRRLNRPRSVSARNDQPGGHVAHRTRWFCPQRLGSHRAGAAAGRRRLEHGGQHPRRRRCAQSVRQFVFRTPGAYPVCGTEAAGQTRPACRYVPITAGELSQTALTNVPAGCAGNVSAELEAVTRILPRADWGGE